MEVSHARIKYLADNVVDIIPIENILEFKGKRPRHVKDFEKAKVYRVLYSDDKNSNIILKVLISDLACGIEEANELECIRPKFARINESDIPNTSSFCDTSERSDEETEPQYSKVQKTKKKKLVMKERGLDILKKLNQCNGVPKIIDSDDDSDNQDKLRHQSRESNKNMQVRTKSSLPTNEKNKNNNYENNEREDRTSPLSPRSVLRSPIPNSLSDVLPDDNILPSISNLSNDPISTVPNVTGTDNNGMQNVFVRPPTPALPNDVALDDSTVKDVFVSQFVINSIEYYKAKEGHGHEEREKRYRPTLDGNIYLGEGKSIKPDTWRMMQTEKPNIFFRELALKLWDAKDLANRALHVAKVTKPIPNRSPTKPVEVNLLRLLISLYSDFLEKQRGYSPEERARFLKECRYILSQKIRDLRTDERRKIMRQTNNIPKKRLRY